MSHGDDPYDRLTLATPEIPIEKLLVDASLLDVWFDTSLPVDQQLANVGRQGPVLAVEHLPDELLHENERDKADGLSPAQSSVYASLKTVSTLQELLNAKLWDRLDQKMAAFAARDRVEAQDQAQGQAEGAEDKALTATGASARPLRRVSTNPV